jgi:TPR repeat protein
MHRYGIGVFQSDREAVKWYRRAAEQGDPKAQYRLGMMYHAGQGVPRDYVRSHAWLNLAASSEANGIRSDAARGRDLLATLMTANQLADAKRLAEEWTEE